MKRPKTQDLRPGKLRPQDARAQCVTLIILNIIVM